MCIRDRVKTETVNQTSLPIQIDAFLNQFELEQEGVFPFITNGLFGYITSVSYTHLRAHETVLDLVCRLLLENKKN